MLLQAAVFRNSTSNPMSAVGLDLDANALIQLNTITLRTLCKAKGIDTTNLKKQAMVDALTSDGKTKKPKRKKSRQKSNNRGGGKENKRGGGNRRNVSIQEPPENDALVAHKCKDNVRKKKKSNKQEEDASSDESSVDLFQYDNVYFGELDELAEEVNQKWKSWVECVYTIKQFMVEYKKQRKVEKARYTKLYAKKYYIRSNSNYTK
eukprot:791570_1